MQLLAADIFRSQRFTVCQRVWKRDPLASNYHARRGSLEYRPGHLRPHSTTILSFNHGRGGRYHFWIAPWHLIDSVSDLGTAVPRFVDWNCTPGRPHAATASNRATRDMVLRHPNGVGFDHPNGFQMWCQAHI